MNEKSIFELLYAITQETDIKIRFNKHSHNLEFIYTVDEELNQVVQPSDIKEYKDNQSQLLTYVLEEIQSTILGSNE